MTENEKIETIIGMLTDAANVLAVPNETETKQQAAYRRGARDAYLAVIDALSELL